MAGSLKVLYSLVALYILLSSSIIAFNRHLLQPERFPYAIALVWAHCVFCSIMAVLLYLVCPHLFPSLSDPAKKVTLDRSLFLHGLLPVALCFSGQLALSNSALKYSSVSFLQMMKQFNIVLVYALSLCVATEKFGWRSAGLLTIVVFATSVTVHGEMHFSWDGFVYQASSQLFECTRIVLTAVLLTSAGKKLDVLTYVMVVMPLCLITLSAALGLLVYFSPNPTHYMPPGDLILQWMPMLIANCCVAFSLNVAMAFLVKYSDAVVYMLSGILKDVFIVAVASVVLSEEVSAIQWAAFAVQCLTILVYSAQKTYPDKFDTGIIDGMKFVLFSIEPPESTKVSKDALSYGSAPEKNKV